MTILFDIETGPLPPSQLEAMLPEFDASEVKTGNLKDPDKIQEKLEQARATHRQQFIDAAALDPMTGQALAIGMMVGEKETILSGNELSVLNGFWDVCRCSGGVHRLMGFNICGFDLPFLIRRSWFHGIPVPGVREGRYWSKDIVDLYDYWMLGQKSDPARRGRNGLGRVAKFLGVGEKMGSGKDFAALYETDREQALAYLRKDLELTHKLAQRMGLI